MNKSYPVKLWLTTVVTGPLLPAIYEVLRSSQKDAASYLHIYPLFFLFGLFYSIPTFLLSYLVYNSMIKRTQSSLAIKTLLNLAIIAAVFLTFWIIGGSMAPTLSIAYSAAAVISSLFYKAK